MRLLARLFTALFGLAMAAAGALLVAEIVWSLLRPDAPGLLVDRQRTLSALSTLTWADPMSRGGAAVLVAAGVLLLLITVGAGAKRIWLHDPAPGVTVTTDRRSLARLVGHQVRAQAGVAGASVSVSAKRVRVKATAQFRECGDLRSQVTETAEHAVRELPMRTPPKVVVSVSRPKEWR